MEAYAKFAIMTLFGKSFCLQKYNEINAPKQIQKSTDSIAKGIIEYMICVHYQLFDDGSFQLRRRQP